MADSGLELQFLIIVLPGFRKMELAPNSAGVRLSQVGLTWLSWIEPFF